jgi:hypothetical protein
LIAAKKKKIDTLVVSDKIIPDWENPGSLFRSWGGKPWAQNVSELLPKPLGMTNFSIEPYTLQ